MAKKVSTNYLWSIVCFIALGLFAIKKILGVLQITFPFLSLIDQITNIIILVVILVSAWNAVAHAKKGWKITYFIFLLIIIVSMVLPYIL